MNCRIVFVALLVVLAAGCDSEVPQTVVVRSDVIAPDLGSMYLVEGRECSGKRTTPGWYRNGLWIFRLTSTRGGVGVVTQELALCYQVADASPVKLWDILHGGGAPLLVLSCDGPNQGSCALYMEGYTEGPWATSQ